MLHFVDKSKRVIASFTSSYFLANNEKEDERNNISEMEEIKPKVTFKLIIYRPNIFESLVVSFVYPRCMLTNFLVTGNIYQSDKKQLGSVEFCDYSHAVKTTQ